MEIEIAGEKVHFPALCCKSSLGMILANSKEVD